MDTTSDRVSKQPFTSVLADSGPSYRLGVTIGPAWAARFNLNDPDEQARIARDAYERINVLLDKLHIQPFAD
jgi:hypothetical protein